MDQQNNTASSNDDAGVLPMDTDAVVNGVHENGGNNSSSGIANGKRGRGRPAKAADAKKPVKDANEVKRGRGRPSKTNEAPPTKKVVPSSPLPKKEEIPTNGDASIKKRGRPSKADTPTEQVNGISKPQVQISQVVVPKEQDNTSTSTKRTRGRPSGSLPNTAVTAAKSAVSKEVSAGARRGRPSGATVTKKVANKSKTSPQTNGSAKQRGRPKKFGGTSSPTAAASSTGETASAASNKAE